MYRTSLVIITLFASFQTSVGQNEAALKNYIIEGYSMSKQFDYTVSYFYLERLNENEVINDSTTLITKIGAYHVKNLELPQGFDLYGCCEFKNIDTLNSRIGDKTINDSLISTYEKYADYTCTEFGFCSNKIKNKNYFKVTAKRNLTSEKYSLKLYAVDIEYCQCIPWNEYVFYQIPSYKHVMLKKVLEVHELANSDKRFMKKYKKQFLKLAFVKRML